jgi:chemotaxis protein MotB
LKRGTRELDQVIRIIKKDYSGRKIDIVGNTDTDPIKKSGWKDNWELSTERALSVVRYLVKHGISSKNVRACGAGSARPVASNSSSTGKAKNRRVEIVVHLR